MSFFKKLFGMSEISAQKETKPASAESLNPVPLSFELTAKDILINQTANDKSQAIALIAKRLLENGYTDIDFTEEMLNREAQVSTYLMNGVAIPHGTSKAKIQILETGIVVAQFPNGVVWSETGDLVYLAVGIAAKNNEHSTVLSYLSELVQDEALIQQLGKVATVGEILRAFSANASSNSPEENKPESVSAGSDLDLSVVKSVAIVEEAGIHARPSALIAKKASGFAETKIQLRLGQKTADAKVMVKLLGLGASQGETIYISAEGLNAQTAVDEIAAGLIHGWHRNSS